MYQRYSFETPDGVLADGAHEVIHRTSSIGLTVDLKMLSTDCLHNMEKGTILPISALMVPRR